MKILYDHQIFSTQKYGGISRYFCELYSHLQSMDTINPEISVVYSENCYFRRLFPQKINLPDQKILGRYLNYGKKMVIKQINGYYCKKQIRNEKFSIFHPTNYDPYFLKYLHSKPYVLTVHDMIHELFPQMFKDTIAIQKKKTIERAAKIIAVSDNTKTDIIKFYDIDPQIIDVIHHGSSFQTIIPDGTMKLPQKYLLYVGSRNAYKNFTFFINSISSLLYEDKSLYLICVGGDVFSDLEMRLFNNLRIKKKVLHYPVVNDYMLSQLYRKAVLFVFPSLYEGFGIPLLEAFSCGCPVAASNCSSLPEVGGNAAIYFDPKNSDSIQKVIENTVQNKSLQDSLRTLGYQRLNFFSWEKTALMTKNVYESILND